MYQFYLDYMNRCGKCVRIYFLPLHRSASLVLIHRMNSEFYANVNAAHIHGIFRMFNVHGVFAAVAAIVVAFEASEI